MSQRCWHRGPGLFLAYLRAAFGAPVLVQISVGQDEKEPFARRGGDPATGAEELHRVELIVISGWCLPTASCAKTQPF